MLSLNKSCKNRKLSLTIHCKYYYFDSTVQRAVCRLPFAVNVKLNLSIKGTPLTWTAQAAYISFYPPRKVCFDSFECKRSSGLSCLGITDFNIPECVVVKTVELSGLSSGRMAIVLASFILAVQEILYPVYFALLFINDQSELNSLVAKNACYIPQGTSHSSDKQ